MVFFLIFLIILFFSFYYVISILSVIKSAKFCLVAVIGVFAALLVSGSVFTVEAPSGEAPGPTLKKESQREKAKTLSGTNGLSVKEIINTRQGIGKDGEATQKMRPGETSKQLDARPSAPGKGQARKMADEETEESILRPRSKKRPDQLNIGGGERKKVNNDIDWPGKWNKTTPLVKEEIKARVKIKIRGKIEER